MTEVTRTSMFSRKPHTVEIPGLDAVDLQRYELTAPERRPLIQQAFPNLSPAAREFIKTGITGEEWAEEFGGAVCGDCNGMGMSLEPSQAGELCLECNGHGYFRRIEED